jgi:phosphotransferase system IIB component
MSKKHYVAALKRASAESAPDDWQERLSQIDGVSVLGASSKQVQFVAAPEIAEKVRAEIGQYINLEEVAGREPL